MTRVTPSRENAFAARLTSIEKRLNALGGAVVIASTVRDARDRFPMTGTFGGPVTTVFLTYRPLANSLHLYLNGLELDEGTDYTLTDATVTITGGLATSGDVIDARYTYGTDVSTAPVGGTVVLLDFSATGWKYATVLQGPTDYASDGVEGSTAYASPTFDDSAWSTCQTPIGWGFGGATGATARNTTVPALSEVWLRRAFPGGGSSWQVSAKVDNWGYLYFNGNRINGTMPSGALSGADSGGSLLKGPFTIPQSWVRSDHNVVALHVQDQAGPGYGPGDVLVADLSVSYTAPYA